MELKGYSTYDLVINDEERIMYWKRKDSKDLHKIFDIKLKQGSTDYYTGYVFDELESIAGAHSMGGCSDFEIEDVKDLLERYKQVEKGRFTAKVYREVLSIIKASNVKINLDNSFSLARLIKLVRDTKDEELMWKIFEHISTYLETEERVPASVVMDIVNLLHARLEVIAKDLQPLTDKFKDACLCKEEGLYIYTTGGDKYYCHGSSSRQYRRGENICDPVSVVSMKNSLDTLFKLTFIDIRPTSFTYGKLVYNKELSDLMYSTFSIDELAKLHLPVLVKEESKEMNIF